MRKRGTSRQHQPRNFTKVSKVRAQKTRAFGSLNTPMDGRTFRLTRGAGRPLESPTDLQVGDTVIPVVGGGTGHIRSMRVRYLPPDTIPRISLKRVLDDPAAASQFSGKAVFVGVT